MGFQRVSVGIKNRTHEVATTLFSHYIISNETELVKKNHLLILRERLNAAKLVHVRSVAWEMCKFQI